MEKQQDTIFWALAHMLVTKQNYEVIFATQDGSELLLTNQKENIRLKVEDIYDSNWLKDDLMQTYDMYEQMKSKTSLGGEKLFNVYFMKQLPTDDDYLEVIAETMTPTVKKLGEIDTILTDEQTDEVELLRIFSMNDERHTSIFHQLMNMGAANITQDLSNYIREKTKKQQEIVNHGKALFVKIFLLIQIAMFVVLELNGGSENVMTLIRFGAKVNTLIEAGEWWRFITPIFLHIGIIHLVMNSMALYYIGTQVEKMFGSVKFVIIYLFAGATGVLASFLFSTSVSAGASGAIFGCFGALLYVGIVHRDVLSKELVTNVLTIIGINLIFGFVATDIDNAGHIGGLIGGFLMAMILKTPFQRKQMAGNP